MSEVKPVVVRKYDKKGKPTGKAISTFAKISGDSIVWLGENNAEHVIFTAHGSTLGERRQSCTCVELAFSKLYERFPELKPPPEKPPEA
jgi:hypothetical protein